VVGAASTHVTGPRPHRPSDEERSALGLPAVSASDAYRAPVKSVDVILFSHSTSPALKRQLDTIKLSFQDTCVNMSEHQTWGRPIPPSQQFLLPRPTEELDPNLNPKLKSRSRYFLEGSRHFFVTAHHFKNPPLCNPKLLPCLGKLVSSTVLWMLSATRPSCV
jgi:hypothetical protein